MSPPIHAHPNTATLEVRYDRRSSKADEHNGNLEAALDLGCIQFAQLLDLSRSVHLLSVFVRLWHVSLCSFWQHGTHAGLVVSAGRRSLSLRWEVRTTLLGCRLDVALVDNKGLNS